MTRAEALTALQALAQSAVPPTLTDAELNAILTQSRRPDNAGRPPSDPAFVEENWDLNYAAALAYELKSVKQAVGGTVSKFASEGASFEMETPDFQAMADWFREQSIVGGTAGEPVFVGIDRRLPYALRPRSELEC